MKDRKEREGKEEMEKKNWRKQASVLYKGRTIRKVMGGGGGGAKAKIKIEQGKQKKKFEHEKSLKKKFVQRLFNRENYKLCKGGPQIWKIKRFLI